MSFGSSVKPIVLATVPNNMLLAPLVLQHVRKQCYTHNWFYNNSQHNIAQRLVLEHVRKQCYKVKWFHSITQTNVGKCVLTSLSWKYQQSYNATYLS